MLQNKWRKMTSVAIVAAMSMSLVACGGGNNEQPSTQTQQPTAQENNTAGETAGDTAGDRKSVV